MQANRFLCAVVLLAGCNEEGTNDGEVIEAAAEGPTFYDDIAPLLAEHCRGCHAPGSIAPFALDSYADASNLAPVIAAAVKAGSMPPWHVGDDGSCNTYRDSKRLTQAEVDAFVDWADAGAPAGEEAPIPPPVELTHLDKVDRKLTPTQGYNVSGAVSDDYRCFVIDPELDTDHFLTAYEVHPGQPSVVHHVVLFSVDTDEEEATAARLDAEAAGPGYPCFGASGTDGGRSLAVWTPGTGATEYPAGTGLRVLAGRSIIMQVHYFGGGVEDLTTVDLTLEQNVEAEALITGAVDLSVAIPPGEESYLESAAYPLPGWDSPVKIHAVYPHMHEFGRTIRVDYDRGDESRCLVDVPDYDFDWQQFFFYEEPIVLDPPGGGHFRISCTFDSGSATEPILFGEGTGDEMCIAALYMTY